MRHYTYTSGAEIADFGYEYDDNGNITAISFDHRDSDPDNDYTYDDLDRLTRVDYLSDQNDNEQFTYDDLGNRTEVDLRDGTTDTYARNELTNRYDDDQGEDIVCEYDNAGNMTKDPNDYEYEYDYENRLIKITKNSGGTTVAEFEYDALGRRIEKEAGSVTTRYYHNNDWQVLCEKDDNGDTQRWFIYGNYIDEPLVMIDSDDDQHYYAHDHLFSTVAIIDDQGNVIERYEYNAYGMPTICNAGFSQTYDSSQYENPYLFTGRRVDNFDSDSLRMQYNRNRYYDYYTGRWLSHDPEKYIDGMNLYEYGNSSPHLNMDPQGRSIISSIWGKFYIAMANEVKRRKNVCCIGYTRHARWDLNSDFWDACTQKDIENPTLMDPMTACKCKFPKGDPDEHLDLKRNFKLTRAKYGKCCWCRIYLVVPIPQATEEKIWSVITLGMINHPVVHVKCDEGARQSSWTFNVNRSEGMWGDGSFSVQPGSQMVKKKDPPVDIEPWGRISCEIADAWYERLRSKTMRSENTIYYNEITWNCVHISKDTIMNMHKDFFNKCK